jgi:hypothetical protein
MDCPGKLSIMNKALRTTLVLVILISAAANAPGLLLTLDNSQGADAKTGSSVAPVDYYAYDYDYDTTPSYEDPGAWLDSLFRGGDPAPVASWRHTWTDFESPPTADALNPYRRPVHWEPEGVLLASVSTFSDMGYNDLSGDVGSFSNKSPGRVTSALFGGFTDSRKEGKGAETPPDDEPDPGPGPGDEPNPPVPDTDPPPPDVTPDPPVSVPEPAPMGLLALGLAGLFMFGKRRRLVALTREGRDRN